MDQQQAQFLRENKDLLKRVCGQLIADVDPNESFLVDEYIDVFMEHLPEIDLERIPSGNADDTPLGFGSATDLLISVLVPVITATLSKLSEYLTVDKLKAKAADKGKKSKEQIRASTSSYEFQYCKKEMNVKLTSNKLTRKKADELSQKILELIAQEL